MVTSRVIAVWSVVIDRKYIIFYINILNTNSLSLIHNDLEDVTLLYAKFKIYQKKLQELTATVWFFLFNLWNLYSSLVVLRSSTEYNFYFKFIVSLFIVNKTVRNYNNILKLPVHGPLTNKCTFYSFLIFWSVIIISEG